MQSSYPVFEVLRGDFTPSVPSHIPQTVQKAPGDHKTPPLPVHLPQHHPTHKHRKSKQRVKHRILPFKSPRNHPQRHKTRTQRRASHARFGEKYQAREKEIHERDDRGGCGAVIGGAVGLIGVHAWRVGAVGKAGEGAVDEEGGEKEGGYGFDLRHFGGRMFRTRRG